MFSEESVFMFIEFIKGAWWQRREIFMPSFISLEMCKNTFERNCVRIDMEYKLIPGVSDR